MQTLNLNGTQLPASKFPERADAYICDKCGRDITPFLNPGRAHVWRLLGPSRYVCRCGQQYLSGEAEWDSLSTWERRNRLSQIVGFGIATAIPIAGFVFLIHAAIEHRSIALLIVSGVAAGPLIIFIVLFTTVGLDVMDLAASLWRTKIARLWRR
jgi:hypothetical protein